MGKALVVAAVAVAVGMLVYWLARPRAVAPEPARTTTAKAIDPASPAPPRSDGAVAPPQQAPPATGPIEPPRTEQERERDSVEMRRRPLYGRLHQDLGAELAAVRASDDDGATLDLYAARDAPGNTLALMARTLQANVAYYGFRHIRFYAPNPAGAIEKFRLDAEANADSAGNWQTFKK